MKAFCEKADLVLHTLVDSAPPVDWHLFTGLTKVRQTDGILVFLKEKGFIEFSAAEISITPQGRDFITTTSFTAQRDKRPVPLFTSKLVSLPR